jgi:precorrin-3B C17-methyltransferase
MELVPEELKQGKELVSTGMRGEMARVNAAIDAALAAKECALVCSGDPGVYALAGLALELLERRGLSAADPALNIVPGIPAVCAAAAALGAPLTHDFACVSLSDLLTPWPLIRKRLECAFAGDFVVALYNPRSQRRHFQLDEALAIALRRRGPETPVGIARNAWRDGMRAEITPLGEVEARNVDMLSILLVGNSQSRVVPGKGDTPLAWASGARLLTPRGYLEKYG